MSVNAEKYSRYVETYLKGGASPEEAHKWATKKATEVAKAAQTKKEGFVAKTGRRMKEAFYGKHTYAKKKVYNKKYGLLSPDKTKAKKDTARTKQVTSQLKSSGLTAEEIARFRKK